MHEPLHIHRILGGGPFAEAGKPSALARDDARGLIAVGGSVGDLQWGGRALNSWYGYRVGVYGLDDLRCRQLVRTRWPVLDLALHPHLPLLAVGTGAYDGGYMYEGELLIVDLEDGTTTSVLEGLWEVRRVRWREDGRALELVVAPPDDDADDAPETHGFAPVLERDDWRRVAPRSISYKDLTGPRVRASRRPEGVKQAARETLAALADAHGATWSPRRQVWALEALDDGRVLAALEGTKLESWSPSGESQWSVPDPDGARELHISPDRTSAWVNVARPSRWAHGVGWEEVPGLVERVSLADGSTLDTVDAGFPAALAAGLDGRLALRDTRLERRNTRMTLLAPDGTRSAGPALGCYDSLNMYFGVRRSPELLFLQGGKKEYWKDQWVVAVDPAKREGRRPETRRLFPLDWDGKRSRRLTGGPAVRLAGSDGTGGALVHAGEIHVDRGPKADPAFVACRRFPDGAPRWVFPVDHPVTALDSDGDTVFAALLSGEIVALDAADGTVRRRAPLSVGGVPTVALSLAATAPGQLVLGTVDGRILLGELPPPQ
ncbi:hypothetical protein ABZW10_15160 [Kitasatospora sp. NPDC004723]|uniref:hypothetical protein n=1 Tax=Kitasatospora sp. NPDC004723 TaxID=3154288 RepID=UPI0033A48E09